MSSSFRQRDPYAMGSTNYLPTGADLSDAMVKEQNLQMEDTSEFYKQMAELEKQRAERPLNLLGDIADFAQSAGPVFKQIAQANQDRNKFKGELEAYDAEQETIRLEIEEGKRPINTKVVAQTNLENLEKDSRNEQLKAKETAKTDSTDPTLSQEDRYVAADAAAIFGEGSFSYQEGLNSRNNAKAFAGQVSRYFDVGSRDDRFTSLDNKVLNDMSTRDEAKAHLNNLQAIILQNYIRQRRQLGLRELSDGEVLKYIAPDLFKAKQKLLNIWQENRDQTQLKLQKMRERIYKRYKKQLKESLRKGEIDLLIGTHALIYDSVEFENLGLAIIDEQHKFGVAQRSKLWHKNKFPPHVLIMTATPIPRTLAMSVYGDLDMSIIDELPPGRKYIKTFHQTQRDRLKLIDFLKKEISKGRQAYVVYPLIKESEKLDFKDLLDGYETFSRDFPMPEYQISIVHGKMNNEDKDYEMQRFIENKTQILVSTTVIEVGVDIPNATVMIIESAERFGLSQLHQLRGRVGRGKHESYCFLITGHKKTKESKIRMETMEKTNDGFIIAEKDLELRGPGNIMGTQQSGEMPLKITNLVSDSKLILKIRKLVEKIMSKDPRLENENNLLILKNVKMIIEKKDIWEYIS